MRRAFAGGVVLLGLSGIAAADEPVGRFQMLLLNPDVNPARVMILDTAIFGNGGKRRKPRGNLIPVATALPTWAR